MLDGKYLLWVWSYECCASNFYDFILYHIWLLSAGKTITEAQDCYVNFKTPNEA